VKNAWESFDKLRARPEFIEGTNGNRVEIVEKRSVHAEPVEAFLGLLSRI